MQSKYPGLTIAPSFGRQVGWNISFWMSSEELMKFQKLKCYTYLKEHYPITGRVLYADNIPYATEFVFFVKDYEWSELENSQPFLELAAYAERLHQEKECKRIALREQERKAEIQRLNEQPFHRAWFRRLWTAIGKWFHYI